MARTFAWRSLAAAVLAAAVFACKEEVTAPGRCPLLCPADSLLVADTLIAGIAVADTSIRGYTTISDGPTLVTSTLASLRAYTVMRFQALPQRWFTAAGDSVLLGGIDSVSIRLQLDVRDSTVGSTRLRLHHLPANVDTTGAYDSVASYFVAPFDSIPVADSVRTGVLTRFLPVTEMTPQASDSFVQSIGISVAAAGPTVAILASSEFGGTPPRLKYYVHGAAPRDTFHITFDLVPTFDSYVQSPEPAAPPSGQIVVGNQPSSRAFIQFNIPSYYVDSVTVLRATLMLEPLKPATGFPGEVFTIEAVPILRYFGGKSLVFGDTTGLVGRGQVAVGQDTTVHLDVARVLRLWHGIPADSLPRAIVLRLQSEIFTFAQLDAGGSSAGALAPRIRISYLRPFHFGVP